MPTSLQDVNRAIELGKAEWTAGKTSVSEYVNLPVETANLFGLNVSDADAAALLDEARSVEASTFHVTAPPPSAIDWRNISGKNYVTAIRNQGNCGSCVAFATCAALESRTAIKSGIVSPRFDLSEAHLFFCGCGLCCKTGWRFDQALNWAKNGIGEEPAFPYTAKNQPCHSPTPSPVVRVPRWSAATTTLARKMAIADNGPVIGGLRVYEDFYFYKSGVYTHVTGVFRGLHAVCVVGYDDGQQCWIIKNSWGAGWGGSGFMRIAYGQCDIDNTYAFYDPDVDILSPASVS
jgi:C1A family cysteine protease